MNDRLKQPPAVAATDPRAQGLTLAEIREQRRETEACRARVEKTRLPWPQAEWGKIHAEIFENGPELCVGLRHEDQGRGIILSVEEFGRVVRQFVQWHPQCLEPAVLAAAAALGGDEPARDLEAPPPPPPPAATVAPPYWAADGFAQDAKDLAGARVGDALGWLNKLQAILRMSANNPHARVAVGDTRMADRIGEAVAVLEQEHAVIRSVLGWPSDLTREAVLRNAVGQTGAP